MGHISHQIRQQKIPMGTQTIDQLARQSQWLGAQTGLLAVLHTWGQKLDFHPQVLRYLGRYTHRIAISKRRIISLHEGKVTFTYKDRKDNDRDKTLTLDNSEFIRRFLIHVLPQGFHKIRYFGLLAIRNRKSKLAEVQRKLNPADQKNLLGLCIIEEASISRPPCPVCGANAWHCLQALPAKLFKSTSKFKPPRPPPGTIELQSNR